MVTTAFKFSQGFALRPPRRLGRPVPPPKHPMLSLRRCMCSNCTGALSNCQSPRCDHNEGMHPALRTVAADLQRIFGARLQSLVAYGPEDHPDGIHTLALVDRLAFQDLTACAPRTSDWQRAGAAVPLLLSREEFQRTLDVFPLEYGGIIASHQLITGDNILASICVAEADLRRGCELQAKSHLIHLREGYVETGGDPARVARLLGASAP